MITHEFLESFKKTFIESVRDNFNRDGFLMPEAMLMNEDYNLFPVVMIAPKDNSQIAEAIRTLCRQHKCIIACLAIEMWVHRIPATETSVEDFRRLGKKVSELPEKKEAVIMCFETMTSTEHWIYEIGREPNRLINEQKGDELITVFSNLLPKHA